MGFWKRKDSKDGSGSGREQSPAGAVGQGLTTSQLIARIQELQWQLGWWEANYGHNLIKAPTQRENAQMMRALEDIERNYHNDDWWNP